MDVHDGLLVVVVVNADIDVARKSGNRSKFMVTNLKKVDGQSTMVTCPSDHQTGMMVLS